MHISIKLIRDNVFTGCKLYAVIMAIILLCAMYSDSAAGGGWQNSWSDEFNGTVIDNTVWGYENGYVRNSELQYYTNRTENARIDSGNLLIQAKRESYSGYKYTSSSLRTMGKKSWLYGRFEIRAKIDIRKGSWPAWWWLPNSGGWPKGGEVDMMEYYNSKCLFNVMDGSQKWSGVNKTISSLGGDAWADVFHVWTMEWDSTKIDLYLDGTLMNHYSVANADGSGPGGANPFRKPGYVLINQAIGGTNGGDPSNTTFPVEYRVDWIRVHVWSPDASNTLTVNNGAGSGPYVSGAKASITAKLPVDGNVFDKWVIENGDAVIDDVNSPTAILTMNKSDVTVTAKFKSFTDVTHHVKNHINNSNADIHKISAVFDINGRKISASVNGTENIAAGVYIRQCFDLRTNRVMIERW